MSVSISRSIAHPPPASSSCTPWPYPICNHGDPDLLQTWAHMGFQSPIAISLRMVMYAGLNILMSHRPPFRASLCKIAASTSLYTVQCARFSQAHFVHHSPSFSLSLSHCNFHADDERWGPRTAVLRDLCVQLESVIRRCYSV
ncbi:hypothetical protein KP509_31G027500 [Ceratopteris richardii]|uniref:Uncharacterized protein n=1 Tax=Ceratopteris richardii TaxID=49495 RepID=A0A8T2QWJ0_CERRI|nr:hypothetical protein KP509_31G027500 [Ceratopteris richardii]